MGTVAIFGAGVMGETLLSGLLRAGRPADELVITERRPERAAELTDTYGVRAVSNVDAAAGADTLILVVKPLDMAALLDEIGPHVGEGNLVVSLAAGITTDFIESHLPEGRSVVRVMPNTPALVDQAWPRSAPGDTACRTTSSRRAGSSPRPAGSPRSPRSSRTPSPRCRAAVRRTSSMSSRR
jgi:pyrroline-5-carboxylate reductase